MKNQYFGDINDYRKYGILRELARDDLSLVICWMLTTDDGRTDGKFIQYLDHPTRFRGHDADLFDTLKLILATGRRDVSAFETNSVIPSAKYVRSFLEDSPLSRREWEKEVVAQVRNADLVFFDPDNGIEVKSVRKGRKDSRKFVYWDELKTVWDTGASVLVYQHFPRIKRDEYLRMMGNAFKDELDAVHLMALVTSNVAFFLAAQPRHVDRLWERCSALGHKWQGQVTTRDLGADLPTERRTGT